MHQFYRNDFKAYFTFELGKEYVDSIGRVVKFIKVTPKGFNFLNVKTSKVLFKGHFYSKDFSHIKIPKDQKKFSFNLFYSDSKRLFCQNLKEKQYV